MPTVNLNKISYTGLLNESDYYVGAVVNSSSGPDVVTIVRNEEELDTYFPDIDDRDGYLKLLSTNSNLVLKRIPRSGASFSTLRLTKNKYLRYVYPEVYSDLSLDPKESSSPRNEIILDNDLVNKVYYQGDLVPGRVSNVSGIISGLFNYNGLQDRINLSLNGEVYTGYIQEDGTFDIYVNEFDIINDEFTQFEFELITVDYSNPSDFISTKYHQDYSISGVNTIKLVIDEFPFLDNIIYKSSFIDEEYPVTGYLLGDFEVDDEINITVGGTSYVTTCNYLGKFSVNVPVSELLDNSSINGVAETASLSGGKAKYVMNYQSDNLDIDLESDTRYNESYIELQKYGNRTLVYDIDFNSSETVNQDYIIIPSANKSHWNANIFIYFLDESNPIQSPNLFVNNPVSLLSVSSPQFPVLIPSDPTARTLWQSNRAEMMYNILTGGVYEPSPGNQISSPLDIGCIRSLCVLDKVNNRLRLIFRTPVNDISYYTSNSLTNKFNVNSNLMESYKLLTRYSRWDSIISFSSLIKGSIDVEVKLEHIKGYQYYLTETYKGSSNTYHISLNRDDIDYSGNNIFAENVINDSSLWIKCIVHLKEYTSQTSLATYDGRYFNFTEAKELEGEYLLTKGDEGKELTSNDEAYLKAIDDIFTSDSDVNIFHSGSFNEKFHLTKLLPYLILHQTVCITTIPDDILNDRLIDEVDIEPKLGNFLLPDESREYILYCFGHCRVNESYTIPSSFLVITKLITGEFIGNIEDNVVTSYLKDEEKVILDRNYINYMDESNKSYNIPYISNLPRFLEPIYLLAGIYAKQYFTRFLRARLGVYSLDLYFQLKSEIYSVSSYTPLISSLRIKLFEVENNSIKVQLDLELTGLMNKSLTLNINLKAK